MSSSARPASPMTDRARRPGRRLPEFGSAPAGVGRDPAPLLHRRLGRPAAASRSTRSTPASTAPPPTRRARTSPAPAPSPRRRADPRATAIARSPRWRRSAKQDLYRRGRDPAAGRGVDRAEPAQLDTARINLRFTTVPAPITGRIGRSLFTVGALVSASQADPLATIQQLDPIFVDIQQSRRRRCSRCAARSPRAASRPRAPTCG